MRLAVTILASALAWGAAKPPGKLLLEGFVIEPGTTPVRESAAEFPGEVLPRDVFSLANLITEPEIYHDFVNRIGNPRPKLPIIDSVEAYPGGGPPGVVLDGALARITGRNLAATVRVMVGAKPCLPLAVGPDQVIARLSGAGPAEIRLVNSRGLSGPGMGISLIRVTGQLLPPGYLLPAEVRRGLLGIEGTAAPLELVLATDTPSVSFGGPFELQIRSTGGSRNEASFAIRAEKPGCFRIRCRLISVTGYSTPKL